MPDREKVIKWADICLSSAYSEKCNECPYQINHEGLYSCVEGILRDALALLKEQDAVKPVLDEQTGRMWLCGKCGSYVGFEDNDPYDPNEYDKYCRECGKPILWEGR